MLIILETKNITSIFAKARIDHQPRDSVDEHRADKAQRIWIVEMGLTFLAI